jgi:CRISPR/Cas system-associated endoribonuclease Cas2
MKKLCLLAGIVLSVLLLVSCATSKEARTYKKSINGNWQLQTVVSEGIAGKIKAEVFNEADFNCFVGSSWSFNQVNSLGSYTINQNGNECVAIKREFRWSIFEAEGQPKLFQFKRLDEKLKEIDEGGGFRFTIVQLDNNTMQLKSDISFEGKPAAFIYNFVRN